MPKKELAKSFDPQAFEDRIYKDWLEQGHFRSQPHPDKKPYTIVIPPPNVTGMLHMGHILNNTIQDILIRYHRMRGYEACWIPGTDHASIATEAKVSQMLAEKGIDKHEIGREKFLEYAQDWKSKYGGIIISQLKKLGASCDWERERFTMDDGYYKAVIHAFVELFNKGYIYKGFRLVNWCPVSRSAISDEEVYYKEVNGKLWHFRYPYKDGSGYVVVATTRPETMLGDTAVAVNPKDKRYKDIVGKTVVLPIVGREIPVIADDYVDMEFGTGVVKITPAHDPNDYEMARRHDLDIINILTENASLNKAVPQEYQGLDRYEAREAVVQQMEALKLVEKIEDYTHSVGYSERGHVPIEPFLSEQWYMRMDELIKPAVTAIKDRKIQFYPERWEKTYFNWMDNIRDWCISRQLWWGHRIPVYYCDKTGKYAAFEERPEKLGDSVGDEIRQDEDVLDTWASSWLWPFAVHAWPQKDEQLKYYYPTNTLVTGPDIIFFWVARMIIAGYEFLGDIPFEKVYFTGIIRDDLGRKMSKSLGNSPDPLDVIAEYGADALRYTIIRLAPLGNDILYSNEKCELGRNFGNKIWNAARFIHHAAGDLTPLPWQEVRLDTFDKWILTRYHQTIRKVSEEIDSFHFNDATISLYDFIWGDYCDWYIESSKVTLYGADESAKRSKISVLYHVLEGALKLLHPVMPFITEEVYQSLPGAEGSIMVSSYPEYDPASIYSKEEAEIKLLQDIIYTVRNIRGEYKIPPSTDVQARIKLDAAVSEDTLSANLESILKLAKLKGLEQTTQPKLDSEAAGVGQGFELYVSLEGLIDTAREKERLDKEIERLGGLIDSLAGRLQNAQFLAKAPAAVIEAEKTRLQKMQDEQSKLQENRDSLK